MAKGSPGKRSTEAIKKAQDDKAERIRKDAAKRRADAKKPKIEKQTYTDDLRCDLNFKEVLAAAEEMARAIDDRSEHELAMQSIGKEFKAKIAACDALIEHKSNLVRNKYEFRAVRCEEVKDFKKGTLTVTRTDTMKVLRHRKLSGEEKQMMLPLSERK